MIAGEAPVLLSKACELLVRELTIRAWRHTGHSRRRTLQKQDVCAAVSESEVYDFLIDIVPRAVTANSHVQRVAAVAAVPTPNTIDTGRLYSYPQPNNISTAIGGVNISSNAFAVPIHSNANTVTSTDCSANFPVTIPLSPPGNTATTTATAPVPEGESGMSLADAEMRLKHLQLLQERFLIMQQIETKPTNNSVPSDPNPSKLQQQNQQFPQQFISLSSLSPNNKNYDAVVTPALGTASTQEQNMQWIAAAAAQAVKTAQEQQQVVVDADSITNEALNETTQHFQQLQHQQKENCEDTTTK